MTIVKTIGNVIADDQGDIVVSRVDYGLKSSVAAGTRCVAIGEGDQRRTMTPVAARALAALFIVAAEDAER